VTYRPTVIPDQRERPVTGLVTLQFGPRTYDDYLVHLVRETNHGTPGPTLCGIERFEHGGPGWSVGGGSTGGGIPHNPCRGCAAAARRDFRDLPIRGLGAAQIVSCIAGTEGGQ
jgi:hypothetical protein